MACRSIALAAGLVVAMNLVQAVQTAQAAQSADLFDFWLGDWDVSWSNADGTSGQARNRVAKILDGRVIEEVFEEDPADPAPLLRGRSLSVLHQASGTWKQAWADNQGGFFSFTGGADGDKRFFATELRTDGDKQIGQRMVFYAIEPNRFTWDWERTSDGGRSWALAWRLEYRRR